MLCAERSVVMNFTLVAALIFLAALVLVVIVGVGERKNGHARDDE